MFPVFGSCGNVGYVRREQGPVSRFNSFKTLYMTFRREVIRLAHVRRTGGQTPFYVRELEAFRTEVEGPMDKAWAALPPTERGIFESELAGWVKEEEGAVCRK